MANEPQIWQPDWAVPPGEILQEALEERGISQSELARRMGRPTKTINEIVNGKAAITPDTAIQLELALGVSSAFWNRLEVGFREHQASQRARVQWSSETEWANAFPLKEMRKRNLIPESDGATTVASLLAFFGVSSTKAWEAEWVQPSVAFRRQTSHSMSTHALAAWLREGDRLASKIECFEFSETELDNVISGIRPLTRKEPISAALDSSIEMLAQAGVALVLVPTLPKVPVSGVARWLSKTKACIQLSLRFKTDDHLWFSLFHELGHLRTRRGETFFDEFNGDADGAAEQDANQFARNALLPPNSFEQFVEREDFSPSSVKQFARDETVSPGIVVGRLQHDELVPMNRLNSLKRRIEWA